MAKASSLLPGKRRSSTTCPKRCWKSIRTTSNTSSSGQWKTSPKKKNRTTKNEQHQETEHRKGPENGQTLPGPFLEGMQHKGRVHLQSTRRGLDQWTHRV